MSPFSRLIILYFPEPVNSSVSANFRYVYKMITLGLLGFDAALSKSLSIALSSRAADVCRYVEPEAASVVLVDIDKLQDQNIWKQLRDAYSSILIAASKNYELPVGYEQDFVSVIPKPLRFTEMLTAITTAVASGLEQKQHLSITSMDGDLINGGEEGRNSISAVAVSGLEKAQRLSKTSVASDLIDGGQKLRKSEVQRSQFVIDPDKFLLGFVLYSVQLDSADQYRYICLDEGHRRTDGQWLVIDKRLGRVYLSINAKVISHTAIMGFSQKSVVEHWINASELAELKSRAAWNIPVEEFIWILTRDTVRNARLLTFDTEKRYRLKCWPNLTRYSTGNRDIAMASFWTGSNASASELASSLGMTISDVLPFATCCFTCGFLEPVYESVAMTRRKSERGFKKVLSMILNKLER